MSSSHTPQWTTEERTHGTYLSLNQDWDLERLTEVSAIMTDHLMTQKSKNFIIDLTSVNFIDSMALGILTTLRNKFRAEGVTIYLLKPGTTVEKILKQSGLFKVFPIYYSESELEKHLSSLPLESLPLN